MSLRNQIITSLEYTQTKKNPTQSFNFNQSKITEHSIQLTDNRERNTQLPNEPTRKTT